MCHIINDDISLHSPQLRKLGWHGQLSERCVWFSLAKCRGPW